MDSIYPICKYLSSRDLSEVFTSNLLLEEINFIQTSLNLFHSCSNFKLLQRNLVKIRLQSLVSIWMYFPIGTVSVNGLIDFLLDFLFLLGVSIHFFEGYSILIIWVDERMNLILEVYVTLFIQLSQCSVQLVIVGHPKTLKDLIRFQSVDIDLFLLLLFNSPQASEVLIQQNLLLQSNLQFIF